MLDSYFPCDIILNSEPVYFLQLASHSSYFALSFLVSDFSCFGKLFVQVCSFNINTDGTVSYLAHLIPEDLMLLPCLIYVIGFCLQVFFQRIPRKLGFASGYFILNLHHVLQPGIGMKIFCYSHNLL